MKSIAQYKPYAPLAVMLLLAFSWAFNFHVPSPLNDAGLAQLEWLYLLDILLVLPAICFWAIGDKRTATLKALAYIALMLLIGSLIIPTEQQVLISQLSPLRYVVLAVILAIELFSIALVILAVKSALNAASDPDDALADAIAKLTHYQPLATLLSFDLRLWSYLLCHDSIQPQYYRGQQHFSYHNKDGCRDNTLGFIVIIAFELPLMHLLLHFLWSPLAANIISGLTLLILLFFIAEYRALAKRPISIDNQQLIIRYGLYPSLSIDIANIASITPNSQFIPRSKHAKRYNLSGTPNLAIELKQPIGDTRQVYLGIDQPERLIHAIACQQANGAQN
ncbi:hypothetical protein [Shewanella waksmanii]|uniref:hypothetical protein n=1 Tax=Shewanella waksmanii TaxID=213783 RepID=UPI00048D37EF|nr:hypothetical protein [Shewanella waksmanii]